MARPVTLFTGQWADLPLETLAKKAAGWGYDGLELACWGDHFEVDKALADDSYCKAKRDLLKKYGLEVYAISTHLTGQCVCDNIDERHKTIIPPDVWGDGEPEGVKKRAAQSISDIVSFVLEEKFGGYTIPSVEQIQDIVEMVLMKQGYHEIAKSYILYRDRHKEIREAKKIGINLSASLYT